MMRRTRWVLAGLALTAAACSPSFQLKKFTTNEALYRASLREFERGKWENAVTGFEKLTTSLPPRDTLLTRSFWYLSKAHQERDEWLLAAQSFQRLSEGAPEDSLADDAQLEAARSYRKLWRKPTLDAQYGETALAAYRLLIAAFPTSPLVATAQKEIDELRDWFARKNLETANFYIRRKAPDSAILYLREVRTQWPDVPTARTAGLRLLEVYRQLKYREEAEETCASLRSQYPGDAGVEAACPAPAATPATATP
jgi:outer membrane protein assembly factor BamD